MDKYNPLLKIRLDGKAQEDPVGAKISSIKIHDIEHLEVRDDEAVDLLPQGTPISQSFWDSPTLDELARSQNVRLMTNTQGLLDRWPGEVNDGFEAAIYEQRQGHPRYKRCLPLVYPPSNLPHCR